MKIKIPFILLFFNIINLTAQDKLVLFFDFNKDVINEKSELEFNNWLKSSRDKEILKISGYTDSVDGKSYNKELSVRRASTVLSLLKRNNVKISKNFELSGFGEDFEQSKIQIENRKVLVYYVQNTTIKPIDQKKTDEANLSIEKPQIVNAAIDLMEINIGLDERLSKAKIGDFLRLENLIFSFNSEKIIEKSEPILLELLTALKKFPKLKIEIHGHICCNTNPNDLKLSFRRSKFVFDYLIKNGINTNRLAYRGFGSSRPIYSLPEKNEAERTANRRVEIMIVKN